MMLRWIHSFWVFIFLFGIFFASGIAAGDEKIIKAYKQLSDAERSAPARARPSSPPAPAGDGYVIGVGDILGISVWKDESLTRQVTVLPDRTISFPLIGRLRAGGLTLEQLRETVSGRLNRFIPEPVISIQVTQINSLMVYVIGKVNRPGRFELVDRINVLQALALAGGLNPYAKSGKVKIFRESEGGTTILPFDYDAISKGRALEQNIVLQRGDVIVVP